MPKRGIRALEKTCSAGDRGSINNTRSMAFDFIKISFLPWVSSGGYPATEGNGMTSKWFIRLLQVYFIGSEVPICVMIPSGLDKVKGIIGLP